MFATSLGALYRLVIQPSPSASSANTLVSRLAAKILTTPQLKLSLADQLAILSTAVHDRQHLVQPGASAEDAVTALVAEDLLYDAGRPAPSVGGGPASSGDQPPPPKLLEKALMMPNFQALGSHTCRLQQHPSRQCSKRSHGPRDGRRLLEAVRCG